MPTIPKSSKESLASLTSRTIEWLRFPMAALVVLLHTGALGIHSAQPVYRTLSILTSGALCRLAVPCFFFVSGYLFFTKMQEWDWACYKGKLKKRVRTLLVPYLLWNVIAAALLYSYRSWRMRLDGLDPVSFIAQVKEWGGWWDADVSFDGPLWFIRHLMFLCLLAPLVWYLVKRWGLYWLALCSVALMFSSSFEGICTFSAGAYFQIHGKDLLGELRKVRVPAYIMSILLLAGIVLVYDNSFLYVLFRGLFILFGIIAAFNLVSSALEGGSFKVRPFLGLSSFFIFAAHNILILHDVARWAVLHLIPGRGTELFNCIDLFLRPTIAVFVCLLLYWLMSRLMPRTMAVLTGGRTTAYSKA